MIEQLPYYPYFPDDFQRKTRHLTLLQKGAFRELMDEMWLTNQDDGTIPDDPTYCANVLRISVPEWESIRAVLVDGPRPVLSSVGGALSSGRLSEELERAKGRVLTARQNGRGGPRSNGKAVAKQRPSNGPAVAQQQRSNGEAPAELAGDVTKEGKKRESKASVSVPLTDEQFAALWSLVPRKQDKADCRTIVNTWQKKRNATPEDTAAHFSGGIARYLAAPRFTGQEWKHGKTLFNEIARGNWDECVTEAPLSSERVDGDRAPHSKPGDDGSSVAEMLEYFAPIVDEWIAKNGEPTTPEEKNNFRNHVRLPGLMTFDEWQRLREANAIRHAEKPSGYKT